MKTTPNPQRENGAYKWFIEELSDLAKPSYAEWLSEKGHLERQNESDLPLTDEEARQKAFCLKLNAEERAMLGSMFDEAKRAAVHNVAAFLEDYLSGENELRITFAGVDIPESPYASMHYDLTCILEGDKWPDEDS